MGKSAPKTPTSRERNSNADPPAEFSNWAGAFQISEATPGWKKFVIPFEVLGAARDVTLGINQGGVGTVWLDDLQVRKVGK